MNKCPRFLFNSFTFSRSVRNRQIIIPKLSHLNGRSYNVRVARLFNILPNDLKNFNVTYPTYHRRLLNHYRIKKEKKINYYFGISFKKFLFALNLKNAQMILI